MGKQYNKILKRRRRKAYLDRRKTRIKAGLQIAKPSARAGKSETEKKAAPKKAGPKRTSKPSAKKAADKPLVAEPVVSSPVQPAPALDMPMEPPPEVPAAEVFAETAVEPEESPGTAQAAG